jgi:hypothetical protein
MRANLEQAHDGLFAARSADLTWVTDAVGFVPYDAGRVAVGDRK